MNSRVLSMAQSSSRMPSTGVRAAAISCFAFFNSSFVGGRLTVRRNASSIVLSKSTFNPLVDLLHLRIVFLAILLGENAALLALGALLDEP